MSHKFNTIEGVVSWLRERSEKAMEVAREIRQLNPHHAMQEHCYKDAVSKSKEYAGLADMVEHAYWQEKDRIVARLKKVVAEIDTV